MVEWNPEESIKGIEEDSIKFETSPRALTHKLEEDLSRTYAKWVVASGICLLILLLLH